jgi:polysaccharide export outer membrane protein
MWSLRNRTVLATLFACASMAAARPSAQNPPQPLAEGCRGEYVIGPEDVLDIAVWDNAALTRTVSVRPDGKISLPLLNDIHAAGLTPMQLRASLTKGLTEFMPSPSVSVLVREIHSFKVAVIGQVKTPGRYEIKDRATVLDVLALAGGLTEFASRGRIVVLRADRRLPVAYEALTSRKASTQRPGAPGQDNFCVHPGDVIVVP